MIESIRLVNFQAHADTKVVFAPTHTVILGTSDHGKSSIQRAINWVRTNRPRGDGFIRIGSDGLCRVELVIIRDSTRHTIIRERGNGVNRYILGDEVFEALGANVPQPVIDLINMSDLNVQRQLDTHFLVMDSSGQIAQYINDITKLDDADTLLSSIMSKKRKFVEEQEQAQTNIESVNLELSSDRFSVVEKYGKVIKDFEAALLTYEQDNQIKDRLVYASDQLQEITPMIGRLQSVLDTESPRLEAILKTLSDLSAKLETSLRQRNHLLSLCLSYTDVFNSVQDVHIGLHVQQKTSDVLATLIGSLTKVSELFHKRDRVKNIVTDIISSHLCRTRLEFSLSSCVEQKSLVDNITDKLNTQVNDQALLDRLKSFVTGMFDVGEELFFVGSSLEESKVKWNAFVDSFEFCPLCHQDISDGNCRKHIVEFFE